ncbi:Signal transduction histidine-protein kinase/phosphatase DegS [Clostridium ljungdahlii DSM 13528]|uniref:histidine kinase n=2 Tax=Clostridium TaxID=1485 RepID=D8GP58_CLOLD|nr:sensor histidine kinase [Clostridium autoethanogenum]ADK15936.1 two-component sensor histidine kinase [Clostridium ljungdahlii DSM 13528]ALU35282.1 DegS sensor signal transduction histidine kinase [Clostridium autoethanogenum DSM 10061]OAA87186.1 Signal transduction histidine-protein kinase/phosphatase DegS [Clostridium ljungdahlii DSM 13528]OVY49639.1 Signal transduction histidine-protein kinase/phosphatase DegS [Clostridium autoethanogenum]
MNNINLDVNAINKIIKNVIDEISSSRGQVLSIVDYIRKDHEDLKLKLDKVKKDIASVIDEVDELEEQDKAARRRLAHVSANFNKYTEDDIKKAYEAASDMRIKFYTKINEEKSLRKERDSLEITIKKIMDNIENGERIINQISIAMGYLEGDVLSALEGSDKNSEMFIGIKILEAQESERKRIARDIHDGPAQHMANAVMKVDICKMVIEKNLEEGLKELEDLKESVKVALKEVRSIIFDLRPMSLDDLGLSQTIDQTANAIFKESNIDVKIKMKPIKMEIEPIIQVAVYRIVQEIFNNIRKHSKAKHANVRMDFGTKYLMLIINDDGVGFNVEETLKRVKTKGASYGLIGILDRVKQLQGEIEIKSSEKVGTTYTVKLPINREVIKDEEQGD